MYEVTPRNKEMNKAMLHDALKSPMHRAVIDCTFPSRASAKGPEEPINGRAAISD
jgi:hypothetical protein